MADENQTAAAAAAADAPTDGNGVTQITIQGLEFDAPQPYKPGTIELTAGEASALNQTLAENLRNNFAPKIKAAMEAYRKANELPEEAEVAVTSLDQDALATEFATYAAEYEFGVRKAGGTRTPTDPVQREAFRIAWDKVKAALVKKSIKLDSVSKEQKAKLIEQAIAKYPDITAEAKRRVETAGSIALEGLDLDGTTEQPTPAAA